MKLKYSFIYGLFYGVFNSSDYKEWSVRISDNEPARMWKGAVMA
jgi:hypothetical protein